jgi:antitoxin component of RelBE/YafQ-DinJ toxin-antitoxin module
MDITLSIDDDVIRVASERAEALGLSVNQLVRNYLEQFAGRSSNPEAEAEEFRKLSAMTRGDSRGWKFDLEEIHQR